ncbi:MAG TPA: hypothetical protein VHM91_23670 [Verrucomicrobiales bacterium]|jgi:hypothetical protein|nr:hypothetical protein [Verrucomicrobiales bacterium]
MELRYDRITVGTVIDAFQSDGVWFGLFAGTLEPDGCEEHKQLHKYILFSKQWHERLKSGLSPDACEFKQFERVISSGKWRIIAPDGNASVLADAPVFIENEITWTTKPKTP